MIPIINIEPPSEVEHQSQLNKKWDGKAYIFTDDICKLDLLYIKNLNKKKESKQHLNMVLYGSAIFAIYL